jgi:hypothetical protein
VQGPNGQVMQDRGKTLTELLKVNPMAAYQQQKQFESDDLIKNQAMVKTNLEKIDLASRLLSGVKDQDSFDQAIETGKKLGIDTSAMGKYYDPNLVNRYQMMSLSAKENLDKQFKDLDYKIKSRGLDITEQNNLATQRAKVQELGIKRDALANSARDKNEKPSVFELERQKLAARDFQASQKNVTNVNKNMSMIDDAISSLSDYSKNSMFGTGPIATAYGLTRYANQDLENLNAKLKAVNLKNMTTTFSGMSKAVDSEGERRAWNGTQADIANDDATNMNILLGQKSILLKDKAEAQAQKSQVLKYGNLDNYVSPIDGKVISMVSRDGEMILVPKDRVNVMSKQGFYTLDQFSKEVLNQSTTDTAPHTKIFDESELRFKSK